MDKDRRPKLAKICTENGHRETDKCGYNMYREWTQTDYQKWLQHIQWMDRPTAKSGYYMYRGWTDRLPIVAKTFTEDGDRQPKKSGYNMYGGWTQTDCQKWLQHVQRMDADRLPKVA